MITFIELEEISTIKERFSSQGEMGAVTTLPMPGAILVLKIVQWLKLSPNQPKLSEFIEPDPLARIVRTFNSPHR